MDIKPTILSVQQLLSFKKQFIIPRFQREYSWEQSNNQEFLEDMLGNLRIAEGTITFDQYFLGTMLFIGDLSDSAYNEMEVVDGQQRLTTITIIFSALSDIFRAQNEDGLSSQLFSFVMTNDINNKPVRILKSNTSYPFFSMYIQDREKKYDKEPDSEEEECIKNAYEYFINALAEKKIRKTLSKKYKQEEIKPISYLDILMALRDQILNSTIVTISAKEKAQAYKIFEILNAKGKRLAHIDLIKNKIFETLNTQEPLDFADYTWNQIKETLYSGTESVGLGTFYRHYWISKYKKVSSKRLYDAFTKTFPNEDSAKYSEFLKDMLKNAKYYMQIINPKLEDYGNKKQKQWLVQSLRNLNDFNIIQVRIALLALYDVKERKLISSKLFKSTIQYLERFHFAYNALLSRRTNPLETIYSAFSIELRNNTNPSRTQQIVNEKLIKPLDELLPDETSFCEAFAKLTYTKKEEPANIKARYAVYMLNCFYSKNEIFDIVGSIEHILPESSGEEALNIGNLIILETELNRAAGQSDYITKAKEYYKDSKFKWIQDFVKENSKWDETLIKNRAEMMGETFYHKILKKD